MEKVAIVLIGSSRSGKTTLIASLIKASKDVQVDVYKSLYLRDFEVAPIGTFTGGRVCNGMDKFLFPRELIQCLSGIDKSKSVIFDSWIMSRSFPTICRVIDILKKDYSKIHFVHLVAKLPEDAKEWLKRDAEQVAKIYKKLVRISDPIIVCHELLTVGNENFITEASMLMSSILSKEIKLELYSLKDRDVKVQKKGGGLLSPLNDGKYIGRKKED